MQVCIINRHDDVMLCPAHALVALQWHDFFICPLQGQDKPRGFMWIIPGVERIHWDAFVWHAGVDPNKVLDPKTHTQDFKAAVDLDNLDMAAQLRMAWAHWGRHLGPDLVRSRFSTDRMEVVDVGQWLLKGDKVFNSYSKVPAGDTVANMAGYCDRESIFMPRAHFTPLVRSYCSYFNYMKICQHQIVRASDC